MTPSDADTPLTADEVADIARFHKPEVHRRQSPDCHVCRLLATLDATRAAPLPFGKVETERMFAALSQPPATPGIDVERLARALAVDWSQAFHSTPIEEPDGGVVWNEAGWDKRELAGLVAAEYDRLALADRLAAGGET